MEKKEIRVDKNIPKSILKGFILAFLTVFIIEHFSTFSYTPNLNTPNIDNDGKIILSGTYDPTTTKVATLYQTTPFGTKIDLPTNGMMCSELMIEGSDFKSYSNKGVLFAKSVLNDYKYFLLFWLVYALIIMFFKKYRLKVLVLILPTLGISCDKTKQEPIINCIRPIDTTKNALNKTDTATKNTLKTAVKHSFVVFKVKNKYFGKEFTIVTGIFNTPDQLSKDEEYMILDDTQAKCYAYLFDKNILERYMMRFDSYAEASQEKEKISKIRNTTNSQTPKTMTKEEQEQAIKELKSITPEEWEEAKRLQIEYEIWENEQKKNNNYN